MVNAMPNLGIIGGGQLGSLLASAARKLNIKTVVITDDKDAPAKNFCDDLIFAQYDDLTKIKEFTNKVDVITFEFENIPFEILNQILKIKPIFPNPSINKIVQNRVSEKQFVNSLGIKTTLFKPITNKEHIVNLEDYLPGILKTNTMGYDGKGQYVIKDQSEIENLNINLNQEYILEKKIELEKEISVIITRFQNGEISMYEPIENLHVDQILNKSIIPAKITKEIFDKAQYQAKLIAEKLNYVGTMCVEYFIDKKNNLLVNEIAPRVHNSGHLTLNAYNISQFENHIRAVCDLEKIKLNKTNKAEIENFTKTLGKVDILFNAVGFVHHGTILECEEKDWDFSFNVNIKSMYFMVKSILPKMIEQNGGSIINISSIASSIRGLPNRFVYGASKAAIIGFTKSIAADFVKQNIRCNTIAPGTVHTPSWEDRVKASKDPVQAKKDFIARQPMGRLGTPEEIAAIAIYLASDESTFATGNIFSVDGGMTI